MINCCCAGSTSCNGSLVVTLNFNCPVTSTCTVTLQYGAITVTLTAPNDSGKYEFTSTTSSGWYAGEGGVITVSGPDIVTQMFDVTLECYEVDVTLTLTRNYLQVKIEGCGSGFVGDQCPAATITVTQGSYTFGPVANATDCSYVNVPITEPDDGSGYIYTVSAYGFDTYHDNPANYFPYEICQSTIILTPDSDHYCCDCTYPTCPQIQVDNNLGSIILNWDTSGSFQGWYGYITANVDAYPVTPGSGPFPYFTNTYELTNCNGALTPGLPVTFLVEYACFVGSQIGQLAFYYANCGVEGSEVRKAFQDAVTGHGGNYGYNGYTGAFSGEPVGTPVTVTSCDPGNFAGTAPPPPDDIYFGTSTITEISCSPYEGLGMLTVDMAQRSRLPAFPSILQGGDKIRVGFVAPCLVNGGAETWQASLARSLDQRFNVVGVAVNGSMIEPSAVEAYQGICPVSEGIEAIRTLAMNVDILVSWGSHDYASSWRSLSVKPYLLSVRHLPNDMDNIVDTSDVDGFVAVSSSALEAIPEPSRSKAVIISNAVDPGRLVASRTRDEVRASWNVSTSDYVVGYLGRLSPEKNPAAMIELARIATEVKVVLVGAGGLFDDLQAGAQDLDNVRLVGPDHRAGDVLQAFDTLIVPSNFESYGLSLVEGLAVGTPVISTNVGVARENPGLTRVVVEATGRALWEALQADRSDLDGTQTRIASGRSWVASNATLEVFGKRWSDHLAGLPVKSNPPGLATMARNFIGAVGDHLANGGKKASEEVQAERKAICEACPLLDTKRNRCLACGCLAMNLKRSWASSECPKGKWGKEE